ncbi:MAG TPA: glycosyltransferase [Ktedonobacteraceae bacterium]|nr:glycosyltransferase [Ktedonobacteraceae bacterium]
MRVLFVTPYVPSRIRVRPFHFIQSLAPSHEISLVSLVCDRYEEELAGQVAQYCASIELVRLPKWQAYANCLRALPSSLPLRVAYYQSPALIERVLWVIRKRKIEVVHGELIKVMPALHTVLARERVPVLYDSVDCISSYLEQQWRSSGNPLHKAFVYTELRKMRRYEQRSLRVLDQVVITSPYDRERLIALGEDGEHIQVVPNGVDTTYFAPLPVSQERDSLVFCAKMDYYPNAQAMLNFCREVLPLIWKARPGVRLTIVGNRPPQAVRELRADPRIAVTGFVPDIRPYLSRASVALAPLLVAAGIQNKVLEALAMGTPVVATPGSCRSLQVQHQRHLLIAEGAQAYANAILRLLEDPALARQLAAEGRQYVEQHYSWQAATTLLGELYQRMHQTLQAQHMAEGGMPVENTTTMML